jgi:hypothetical protein
VSCLIVDREESWVNFVERWGKVLALSKNCTPVDVMEENIEFMQLVGITAVVVKDVLPLLAAHPIGDTNRFGAVIGGSKGGGKIVIWS